MRPPNKKKAKGYVIFPSVGEGGLGVGAAAGTGQLLEKGKVMGEARLRQVSVGLQAGGQAYIELICFEDQTSLDDFKKGNFEFSAQVSAVAVTAGVAKNAKYEKSIMVLTVAKGGLMYEASVGGQKFKYEAYWIHCAQWLAPAVHVPAVMVSARSDATLKVMS